MRLLQFVDAEDGQHVGLVDGDQVVDLTRGDRHPRSVFELYYDMGGDEEGLADVAAKALQASQGDTTFLEASSFETLQQLVDANQNVDLVLLDLHMPGVSGFAGQVYLCKRYPSVPVVIISANEDPMVIQRALEHGAAGFIPKSSDLKTITNAIGDILMGEIWHRFRNSPICPAAMCLRWPWQNVWPN